MAVRRQLHLKKPKPSLGMSRTRRFWRTKHFKRLKANVAARRNLHFFFLENEE